MIPNGIVVNESTNWRPIYSWPLIIIVSILFSCFIFIPTAILSKKALKIFQDPKLKSKSRYFFVGIFVMLLISYGGLINLALNNPLLRDIWGILALLVVPAGIMIYYGIGHKL